MSVKIYCICLALVLCGNGLVWAESDTLTAARKARADFDLSQAKLLLEQEETVTAEILLELGWLYFDCLETARAEDAFRQAVVVAERTKNAVMQGRALCGQSRALILLDQYPPAKTCYDRATTVFPHPRNPADVALLAYVEGALDFDRERTMQALATIAKGSIVAKAGTDRFIEARCFLIMGEQGSYGQRLTSLLQAVDLTTSHAAGPLEARARLALARHERMMGRMDKALSRLVQVSERLQRGLGDRLIYALRFEEGTLRKELNRWAGAIRSLVLARAAASRFDEPLRVAETSIPLAHCCSKRNLIQQGIAYVDEGLELIEDEQSEPAGRLRKRLIEARDSLRHE